MRINLPESWHDTLGQYIECTCKITTNISTMTDNIMMINQVKLMQEITTNAKLYKATKQRTESHGLAYQTVTS